MQESGGTQVVLVALFIAKQVINETMKLLPPGHPAKPAQEVDELTEDGYTLFDHMERVRYLELNGKEQEAEHLRAILKANLQGLEDFVTDERYMVLVGKMAYNAYGISPAGGRDDKVRIPSIPFFFSLIPACAHVRSMLTDGDSTTSRQTTDRKISSRRARHTAPRAK